MNRRFFLQVLGCGCLSLGITSCSTVPITERKQLKLIPESTLNAKAAQIYEKVKEKEKLSNDVKTLNEIKEIDKFTTYSLPDHLIGIIWKGRYKGQKQKWFIVKFNGDEKEININTKKPEFLNWKWVNIEN